MAVFLLIILKSEENFNLITNGKYELSEKGVHCRCRSLGSGSDTLTLFPVVRSEAFQCSRERLLPAGDPGEATPELDRTSTLLPAGLTEAPKAIITRHSRENHVDFDERRRDVA